MKDIVECSEMDDPKAYVGVPAPVYFQLMNDGYGLELQFLLKNKKII